jgi:UDP-glucose-4-epimerase GalE
MTTGRPTILVTGGAGYIGSHCCKALFEAGFCPVSFDNLSTGHPDFVKWGPSVVGDLRDAGAIARIFEGYDVKAVMHLAALSAVGESVAEPEKYYGTNVVGTLSLLRAMREAGCSKLIFSSTGAVYGNATPEPIREDAQCQPINPYGNSKWMIERILADFRQAYRLSFFCFRYFNASGADPSGLIGELRETETHLIPRALMALQGYVGDFGVYGDDYQTDDGTAVRDYVHVVDLAAAHVRALSLLMNGHNGGIYNLGTGVGYSVKQVLSVIESETRRSVPLRILERRAGDPPILVADPRAAHRVLGLRPICSDLKTIIRSAWAWHLKAHPSKHLPIEQLQ